MMSKKEEMINLRVTPNLKEKIIAKAQADKRTLSNYITKLIEEDVEGDDDE